MKTRGTAAWQGGKGSLPIRFRSTPVSRQKVGFAAIGTKIDKGVRPVRR